MKLTVTQNINKLSLQVTQSNTIVKLQPILNSSNSTETDPIFQASEASLFVAGDKANLDNQSGINSGDETTSSIQTKRPLKTVNGESLEGSGDIVVGSNITKTSQLENDGEDGINSFITAQDLPIIPTNTSYFNNNGSDGTSTYVETDELGAVAFSNDYNDLDNKPVIPTVITNHSELTLDDGTNPHGTTKNDVGLANVPNLDTTDAVNNSHTHSNKSILDLITEPFTTSLKSLYDGAVTSINNLLLTGQRLITSGEITKLSNTSGTNTGDETTSSIQTKRPLKTIEGQSLEGSGNIDLTKNDIGLGNVDNTSDLNKPISTATQIALDDKLDKVSTSGVERVYTINPDGSQGTKATSEFKGVLEFANLASFPTTGETGIIFVALDTNKTYRWSGSVYVQIGGTAKKTENLFFQDAVGSTVRTITADKKNMHQSRFLANASPYGVLGLTLGNGILETGGVINLSNFSDSTVSHVTGNYIGKVKKIVFSYARNVSESGSPTNLMIRVMADTKYNTDMQLIAEHNLISSSLAGFAENKVELPILSHLPLSPFSNIRWCVRTNNATAQQFGIIRLNVITEEI